MAKVGLINMLIEVDEKAIHNPELAIKSAVESMVDGFNKVYKEKNALRLTNVLYSIHEQIKK